MKIEVIKPTPEPVCVRIEIPIELAQMIVVSMGRNHTGDLPKGEQDTHYDFYDELSTKVGRGGYTCEQRERGIWLVKK